MLIVLHFVITANRIIGFGLGTDSEHVADVMSCQ